MQCPKCKERNVVVYTKLLCTTGIFMNEGELVTDTTETQEGWQSVEPEYVICNECQYRGTPEEFGLYTGKFIRDKMCRLIHNALENDGLGALPGQIMKLVLPHGGVVIHPPEEP